LTSQRVLKVLFYVNISQCFFVVENITANAVSVAIGDNGNRLIFEIWWNFFYDLFSIKVISHGQIIMDAVEDYARRWIKREVDQDPESLLDWVRTIRSLVQGSSHKSEGS
jgi:hypothetical protein